MVCKLYMRNEIYHRIRCWQVLIRCLFFRPTTLATNLGLNKPLFYSQQTWTNQFITLKHFFYFTDMQFCQNKTPFHP